MARGDLRHALALENPGLPVPDGEGGFTEGWTPLDPPTMWASIEPAAATDLQRVVGDAQVIATASHLIELDYHPDITIKTRLTWTRPAAARLAGSRCRASSMSRSATCG